MTIKNKQIIFIVGCQRSGTSVMLGTFSRDERSKVYNESDVAITGDENSPVLLPYNQVKRVVYKNKESFIVLKPLCDSQHIDELLELFPNSKAIWLYRDYRDVVNSSINKWNMNVGIRDLTPIARDEENNWRSDGVSEKTKALVKRYFSSDMNPYDANALFGIFGMCYCLN